jgi:L-fuconolactonase
MFELTPLLQANAIDATIVVQAIHSAEETSELLALAHESPVIAGVVGWTDLRAPDLSDNLSLLKELPGGDCLVGIRHAAQDEEDDSWLSRPQVIAGLGKVESLGLTYDLLVRHRQIPSAIEAVKSLPDLRFVLDHFGKPAIAAGEIEPWRAQMFELARYENVVVKFSGLITEADPEHWRVSDLRPYVDVVLSAFGPQRLIFGSDWPVCTLGASYDQVINTAGELVADLNTEEKDSLFGQTAINWYALDVS